jgi:hypothetical protein
VQATAHRSELQLEQIDLLGASCLLQTQTSKKERKIDKRERSENDKKEKQRENDKKEKLRENDKKEKLRARKIVHCAVLILNRQ